MKNIFILIIIFTITLMLFAQEKPEQNEEFDPLTLNEPPLPFMDGSMIYEIITDIGDNSGEGYFQNNSLLVEKTGWKVQIFSSTDFYITDSIYNASIEIFHDIDVEKIFNSPYYKIRIGNCENRSNAELLLEKARNNRFNNAWIITTRIKVKESILPY